MPIIFKFVLHGKRQTSEGVAGKRDGKAESGQPKNNGGCLELGKNGKMYNVLRGLENI